MSNPDTLRWAKRRLAEDAVFLLPFLEKGLNIIDAGCGPGSMTLEIAEHVAPGLVMGVDTDQDRLAIAHHLAREADLDNVQFHLGDATALPLRDGAIDIVFANGLIEHLRAPHAAVGEFHRVLKIGGIAALRSPDWGAVILEPAGPELLASIDLRNRWQRQRHGEPETGRKLKSILRTAGFTDITVQAEAVTEAPLAFRDYMHRILRDPELDALATRHGWLSSIGITDMVNAWSAWANHPDAFAASFWCHAAAKKS